MTIRRARRAGRSLRDAELANQRAYEKGSAHGKSS